ncbi:hypothetical protein ACV334_34495, partial [Pseudomonas aeruginosa]
EIGGVLEVHLTANGRLRGTELDEERRLFLAENRAAYEAAQGTSKVEPGEGCPAGAQLCGKCNSMAVVQMAGCATCLNYGHSKWVGDGLNDEASTGGRLGLTPRRRTACVFQCERPAR